MRRTYEELDSTVKKALENFGKKGGSVREIANKAKINWRTTRNILEKFEKLGIAENVISHQRLKIYRVIK
jgi:ribosomal protein S25